MAKLIKKDAGFRSYGLCQAEKYTCYFLKTKFGYSFFRNLIGQNGLLKEHRKDLARLLLNIRSNQYRFLKQYCGKFNNPVDFLTWVKESGYSFEHFSKATFEGGTANRLNFHGNLKECSHCFRFVIYDLDYFFREVKPLLPGDFRIEHFN